MRIGPVLPNGGEPSRDGILGVARLAEARGFDAVWATMHTAIPVTFESRYPYSPDGRPKWNASTAWGDAFISLALAAAVTERIRLGPSVIPLIITDPLTLAKQAATLDVYSNGRFELGIGAGWLVEEGEALGRPTDKRSARLEETIEILRLAWRKETFSHRGPFWSFPEVGVNPKPPQGDRLPIWIGGHGQRAIEIAVRHGCGMMLWFAEPPAVSDTIARLRAAGGSGPVAAALPLATSAGRWLELCRDYADAGLDTLILSRYGYGSTLTAELERFAAEVLPQIQSLSSARPRG